VNRPLPRLLPALRGLLDPPPKQHKAPVRTAERPGPACATGALGRWGERAAARHLQAKGYRVLARNHRTGIGEADLICLAPDRRTHVLVEVKTRRDDSLRPGQRPGERRPEAAITARKARKLRHLVELIARSTGRTGAPWRIDVVAVRVTGDRARIDHHERAVTG